MILNGHEYAAVAAQAEGIGFTKEGNCFTGIADSQGLARVADAWPRDAATGRLGHLAYLGWRSLGEIGEQHGDKSLLHDRAAVLV